LERKRNLLVSLVISALEVNHVRMIQKWKMNMIIQAVKDIDRSKVVQQKTKISFPKKKDKTMSLKWLYKHRFKKKNG
jgi:hypothetical protein